MGNVTHVVAILKLPQILRKMLPADMDVRSADPALERRPEAFNGVHASAARRGINLGAMIHFDMVEPIVGKVLITAELIGVDGRSG
mgnify:CR=1 FL=1